MSASDPTAVRWKRFGMDRLYVTAAGETGIGYWDLAAGQAHPSSSEDLPALLAAVDAWLIRRDENTAQRPVAAPACDDADTRVREAVLETAPRAESGTASRPWLDLATNPAGAEARKQAVAAREAAPFRTLLARALGVHTDERGWRIGADGEEKVAAQLAKVVKKDPRWRCLHAIPVGDRGSDIDHLVIGPGGVFTVNAKHHPRAKIWVGGSTLMVNGVKQPYIRNSRYEASRAARLLTAACGFPIQVEGLIVTVNADDVVVKNVASGVHVLPRRQVAHWLLRHGDTLTDGAVQAVYDAGRRSTTWRP